MNIYIIKYIAGKMSDKVLFDAFDLIYKCPDEIEQAPSHLPKWFDK